MTLRTGQLADQSGVHIETLRFYERRGLLPQPPRTGAGYRAYPPHAVDRVVFIKRAQDLGFTLKEIAELLEIGSRPDSKCAEVKEHALNKIGQIDAKIQDLKSMRRALLKLTEQCPSTLPTDHCPILNLASTGQKRAGKNEK